MLLLLRSARIIDARGETVATLGMEGALMMVRLPEAYREVYVTALVGRPVDAICNVLTADPRATQVSVASAANIYVGEPCMVMELADRLVPLLPSTPGRERWRPRRIKDILRSWGPDNFGQYIQHSTKALQCCYAQAAAAQRRASAPSLKIVAVPRTWASQTTSGGSTAPAAAVPAKLP